MVNIMYRSLLALKGEIVYATTDDKSTVFMDHAIRLFDHWLGWEVSPAHAQYVCYKDRRGEPVRLTWADVLEAFYEGVQEKGISMNLRATYEYLSHGVLCLAYWDGGATASGRTEWPVQHFLQIVSLALGAPPPAALHAQPKPEEAGEGSGEPQPEAMQFGEGSGEPQPEAMQFGEGSGEPQPEAMQFGEGSGEPQPEAMQFGEGILEPQPEAMQFGEGSGEPQPEAMQFGEGSGEPQPEAMQFGEGSGEPQPEAMQFGEGSGEPQPEAMQFGEGSGEPQPEAMQFGEGSGEPQPEAMQFGEGSGEPQPEAMQFGEGILEPQPEAVQFGEGILEPQPEAMEIGEGILEPHSEAEEPATTTSVERSGARRRLAGVPMDTDAVRGIKRYRLRETYERELSRYKNARRRYSLRNTEARQERLADMEQDLKRERNAGSERSRKRSRL